MKSRAFTLIELLVVVLIIGILAAIALPQYQKAVDKSRYATMIPYVRALANAQELYYLENGNYTTNWESLTINYPQGVPTDSVGNPILGFVKLEISTIFAAGHYLDSAGKRVAAYCIYNRNAGKLFNTVEAANKTFCFAYDPNLERGAKICKSFGGVLVKANQNCGITCDMYELP